jgi:SAM-dependent methyltransferase
MTERATSQHAAFDTAAETYDKDFTQTDLGRWLRDRVWKRLTDRFQSGDSVLEIGCGTGEDAVWLAERGVKVLATDASPMMRQKTQEKVANAGLSALVQVQALDLNQLPDWAFVSKFDGVFSNFGVVNCTRDWKKLATFLSEAVKPSGFVGLGVMSPFCMWETMWHGLHLDFGTAFRRLKRHSIATLVDGSDVKVYYPSARQLATAFSPYFAKVSTRGIGVFLPPSDVFGVIEKRPVLAKRLMGLEEQFAHRYPFRTWADHYWIEFVRSY